MKGLLIKDFCLLKNVMRTIILVNILAVFLSATKNNPLFIIAYVTFFFGYLSVTTISYDELDNGISYLMTLPITPKAYVRSKYILGLLMVFSGSLIGSVLISLVSFANTSMVLEPEEWTIIPIYLFLSMITLSILLPVEFKFGMQKARIVIFAITGTFLAALVLIAHARDHLGLSFTGIRLPKWSITTWLGLAAAVTILLSIISYGISVWIMQKRQY